VDWATWIERPPRSPDLTPIDFFIWDHLKTVVYKTLNNTTESMKQKLFDECRNLTSADFQNIRQEFEDRLYKEVNGQEINGLHFEHLI